MALDARTGKPVWSVVVPAGRNIVRRLVYSEIHDLLFPLGNRQVYRGADGKAVWKTNQTERGMTAGDLFWGYGNLSASVDLTTRKSNERTNPLTRARQSWKIRKTGNGCGPIVAGRHLVTLRSGSGAYYDLANPSGVVNFGAFRSSCQPSLIPANGLLVSPNSAGGGCTCRYPTSTALAMIHAPEMEKWGSYGEVELEGAVRRLGLNFGAPGDRAAANGTLWLDYPSVGGPSPRIGVKTVPEKPSWFRHHASRGVEGAGHPWVAASGSTDLETLTVTLGGTEPRLYRVRVTYAEPTGKAGRLRSFVRETRSVRASRELSWTFKKGGRVCGVEIVDEELVRRSK